MTGMRKSHRTHRVVRLMPWSNHENLALFWDDIVVGDQLLASSPNLNDNRAWWPSSQTKKKNHVVWSRHRVTKILDYAQSVLSVTSRFSSQFIVLIFNLGQHLFYHQTRVFISDNSARLPQYLLTETASYSSYVATLHLTTERAERAFFIGSSQIQSSSVDILSGFSRPVCSSPEPTALLQIQPWRHSPCFSC